MTDRDFFRSSAHECRQMALRVRTEYVRSQLLLWAHEFDAMAAARDRASVGASQQMRQRKMEAAD